jgi:hypothetical protein
MMNGINYSYINFYQQHNVALFPEIYYYTLSGWRFKLNVNYNIYTSGNKRQLYNNIANAPIIQENETQSFNQSYNFGIGVRKEFGIPIPFTKKKYADIEFIAFLDINGNGEKDKGEQVLENVVIKYGDYEVITNERGEAIMENYAFGTYRFIATPLVPLDGWFCSVSDSVELLKRTKMPVPFVRGVKIKGKVSLDREALAADADKTFDLSRIKIMAQNGKVFSTLTELDGSFEFFLPYGKYIFTMDENILSDRFILTQNNIELDITGEAEGMYISFFIVEKKRKVVRKKFGSETGSNKTSSGQSNNEQGNLQSPSNPNELNKNLNAMIIAKIMDKIDKLLDNPKPTPQDIADLKSEIEQFFDTPSKDNKKLMEQYNRLNNQLKEPAVAFLRGLITMNGGNIQDVLIDVKDKSTGKSIGTFKPNRNNKRYLVNLKPGKTYQIEVSGLGFETFKGEISAKNSEDSYEIDYNITLKRAR